MQTGRCQCGEICYESSGQAVGLYICHCRECQKQSASAFGISLDVPQKPGFAALTQATSRKVIPCNLKDMRTFAVAWLERQIVQEVVV